MLPRSLRLGEFLVHFGDIQVGQQLDIAFPAWHGFILLGGRGQLAHRPR